MERAECVVVFGATELFAQLRQVDEWPQFTEGLLGVVPIGHHRYRWDVMYAGQPRKVNVVVTFDHRRRRIAWKSLHRPSFDGGIRLVPLDAHRTRVHYWLSVDPVGLLQTMVAGPTLTNAMVARNMQRLCEWAASRPPVPRQADREHQARDEIDLRDPARDLSALPEGAVGSER